MGYSSMMYWDDSWGASNLLGCGLIGLVLVLVVILLVDRPWRGWTNSGSRAAHNRPHTLQTKRAPRSKHHRPPSDADHDDLD